MAFVVFEATGHNVAYIIEKSNRGSGEYSFSSNLLKIVPWTLPCKRIHRS